MPTKIQKVNQALFDKTYNMYALKKQLKKTIKDQDKFYVKHNKLNKNLLKKKNDLQKRITKAKKAKRC